MKYLGTAVCVLEMVWVLLLCYLNLLCIPLQFFFNKEIQEWHPVMCQTKPLNQIVPTFRSWCIHAGNGLWEESRSNMERCDHKYK